ncbi:MAG: glycine zipper 2TM domain-containing protein, partial [Acidovorax sp.]|nr:glycine zipper 2TM domain-containing protein [Acidovorax sp.]
MHKSTVLALLALGAAGAALAQEQGRVLSSTPIIQQVPLTRQICNAETVYSGSSNSGAGAILGAIAGGAIGNSIGGGSGRAAATALGIVGGALVGNQVEGAGQP